MGPMGYGRGPMSLMGMVRGMGGYGGMNPYARMGMMQGGYGAPPQQQQGSFMRPIGAEGMGGAADANMQALQQMQGAPQQQNDYSRQMAEQLGANASRFGTPTDITPMIQSNAQAGSGPATPAEQAAYENSPALAAARSWASGFGQQVMPGVYGAGAMVGPQQGAYGAPARGMGASTGGMGYGGGWGGPMSLGALARMGMFRR